MMKFGCLEVGVAEFTDGILIFWGYAEHGFGGGSGDMTIFLMVKSMIGDYRYSSKHGCDGYEGQGS